LGPGRWSHPDLECFTPSRPLPAPQPITVLGGTNNTATITWPDCQPPYQTLEFEVQLRKLSNGTLESGQVDLPEAPREFPSPDWRTVWQGDSNTVRITQLENGCTYAARIRTSCDHGLGEWSPSYEACSLQCTLNHWVCTQPQLESTGQPREKCREWYE
jgi:Fibronectin type III domain